MEKKRDRKEKVIAAVALSILLFLMYVTLYTAKPSAPSLTESELIVTELETAPVEYQLAYLDSGHLPRGTDVNAARIRYLLKSLAEKTGDTVQHIARSTSASTESLKRDYGREVTRQRFLEEANNYYKGGGSKMNYDSLSAMLVSSIGK